MIQLLDCNLYEEKVCLTNTTVCGITFFRQHLRKGGVPPPIATCRQKVGVYLTPSLLVVLIYVFITGLSSWGRRVGRKLRPADSQEYSQIAEQISLFSQPRLTALSNTTFYFLVIRYFIILRITSSDDMLL